ncbi:MAG: hypothetical protein LBQ65_03045 [Tannerellaceae bacterium]|nr:hypothetical protein [Tannerellaceae bacterium]
MKTYKESLLEYSDVRAIADYARDEGIAEGLVKGLLKGRAEGIAEGIAEGLVKGKWENTVQVVMNSHRTGLPLESIAIVTGLSIEEVESIISSQLS